MDENCAPSDFYVSVLKDLLSEGVLSLDSNILVVCGGEEDHKALTSLGFRNVTISNLDVRMKTDGAQAFAPYAWSYQDAEELSFSDGSFEFVIVHSGLHHLRCPQKGITEMYRVASSGIIGFEPNRNLFTKLGVAIGFGQEYETAAVFYNECKYGGVANTAVPNFVYRFSEDDVIRAIQANCPIAKHHFRFWYATRLPDRLFKLKSRSFGAIVRLTEPLLLFLGRQSSFLANNMAFLVRKPAIPDELFPWLTGDEREIRPNVPYLADIYTTPTPDEDTRGLGLPITHK